jgi:hypothetical protein
LIFEFQVARHQARATFAPDAIPCRPGKPQAGRRQYSFSLSHAAGVFVRRHMTDSLIFAAAEWA